jgi:hypothetical protein
VPGEAGRGNARVTLAMAGWQQEKVAPARCAVPLAEPRHPEQFIWLSAVYDLGSTMPSKRVTWR